MSKKLENRAAVITGATSGMALATAKLFVEEGAYVFVTGPAKKDSTKQSKKSARMSLAFRAMPAISPTSIGCSRQSKRRRAISTSSLLAPVLASLSNPLGSITEKGFDDTFNVNVRGTLFTVQKALPLMNDGGSIILNSSIAGVKGFPGTTVYSASKAAVRSFARTWTADLKGKIRVNVISPGTIDTAIFDGAPQEMKNGFVSIIPMGRIGKPREIASAAGLSASDDSSFVTGIERFVDGGTAQV